LPQQLEQWLYAINAEQEESMGYFSEEELRIRTAEVQLRRKIADDPNLREATLSLLKLAGWDPGDPGKEDDEERWWRSVRVQLFLQHAVYLATSYERMRDEFFRLQAVSSAAFA